MSTGESAAGVLEGDILAGKYRVERVLGAGGMGVVVAAYHVHLHERVALKFLQPSVLQNPEAMARFDREARAAVKIKSEHVARVTDVGRLENGSPYMVMEYLEGSDLASRLQGGPLAIEQAIEFVLQASEALAEAHSLGIVHRDLKPANLFCIRRADGLPSIKVLDFGISKLTGPATGPDAILTRTQGIMGSPLYMSPEQIQAPKTVDARADIWALGVILFELVTGHGPFPAESLPELVFKIVSAPATPLREARSDAPPELEAVIAKCLAKERAARYANVAELAHALLAVAPTKRLEPSVERISRILLGSGYAPPSQEQGVPPGALAQDTGATSAALPVAADARPASASPTGGSWGRTAPPAASGTPRLGARGALLAGVASVGLATIAFMVWQQRVAAPRASGAATASANLSAEAHARPDPLASTDTRMPTSAPALVAPSTVVSAATAVPSTDATALPPAATSLGSPAPSSNGAPAVKRPFPGPHALPNPPSKPIPGPRKSDPLNDLTLQ